MSVRSVLCMLVLACTGCASSENGNAMPDGHVAVSGTVKLDGTPLPGAVVTFVDSASSGVTDTSGRYSLFRGALVGSSRVRVNKPQAAALDPQKPPATTPPAETIPEKYSGETTELKVDVPTGGIRSADFELTSK